MALLTREEILAFPDLKQERVEVDEWGGKEIIVSEITAQDFDEWAAEAFDIKGEGAEARAKLRKNYKARALAFCIVDEDGNRLFEAEDMAALGRKSFKVIERLYRLANKLNGFTPERIEETKKN